MNRRNFIKSMLVACAAPAIVKADSLMGLYVPKLIVPDSITKIVAHDGALNAYITTSMGGSIAIGDIITIGDSRQQFMVHKIDRSFGYGVDEKLYLRTQTLIDVNHINAYGA